jgi:hypothetical protein
MANVTRERRVASAPPTPSSVPRSYQRHFDDMSSPPDCYAPPPETMTDKIKSPCVRGCVRGCERWMYMCLCILTCDACLCKLCFCKHPCKDPRGHWACTEHYDSIFWPSY